VHRTFARFTVSDGVAHAKRARRKLEDNRHTRRSPFAVFLRGAEIKSANGARAANANQPNLHLPSGRNPSNFRTREPRHPIGEFRTPIAAAKSVPSLLKDMNFSRRSGTRQVHEQLRIP